MRHGNFGFTLFLGALAALPPLSIDMGLPGFPGLQAELGASASEATQTLSLFLLGFACGPIVLGPLSDRFGRRPVLLGGLLVFTLAGLGCALAGSTGMLLFCRLVQGIGAGAGATMPFAIVRDLFEGVQARTRISAVTLVLGVGPVVAPILGAWVVALGSWRLIYALLGLAGLVLLLVTAFGFRESAPDGRHHGLSPRQMLVSYRSVLGDRAFLVNSLLNAFGFGALFSYISGSPEVMMGVYGTSSGLFSLFFGCCAATLTVGALLNGWLSARHVSAHGIMLGANLLTAAAAVAAFLLALFGRLDLAGFVLLMAVSIFGFGMMSPNATHGALQPMGRMAGVASAALRSMQMVVGAIASALVGLLYDGHSALALTGVMAGFALTVVLVQLLFLRPEQVAVARQPS
jgi:DHA1 family bicyclomycin/chloramphenicol resistance-like MFS transporter